MRIDKNPIELRSWAKLEFGNPAKYLKHEIQRSQSLARYGVKLRPHVPKGQEKRVREVHSALVFCFLMSHLMKRDVLLAIDEASDYDFVTQWHKDGMDYYAPLQVKELVPETKNPHATLNQEIQKLQKYNSPGLTVAIEVNREMYLDYASIDVPKLNLASLWVFGLVSKEEPTWVLHGDLLAQPKTFRIPLS